MQRGAVEEAIENRLIAMLVAKGIACERRVRMSCGIADVVTDDTVYEVKNLLTHDALFKAFAQVTLYAACLDKQRRVIVGRSMTSAQATMAVIRAQGVEIYEIP